METKYGFNPEIEAAHQDGSELKFGATSKPGIVNIPISELLAYLPKGELQNIGEEKFDCATRAPLNILEAQFTYAVKHGLFSLDNLRWLCANDYVLNDGRVEFSDRLVAIKSGTDPERGGNSLKAPLQACHEGWLIPKAMFPQVPTTAEYYDVTKITPEMEALACEFEKRFLITYEQVTNSLSMLYALVTAGYAWPAPVDGIYPRTEEQMNHAFVKLPLDPKIQIFDNYIDSLDGDFIKRLATDYNLIPYDYRVFVAAEKVPEVKKNEKNWFLNIFAELFDLLKFCVNPREWHKTLGAARSGAWPRVRAEHLAKYPLCAVCNKKGVFRSNEAHHIEVFYKNPALELDPNNIITLCRQHHLEWGHLGSFRSWNKNIREDAARWRERVQKRP